MNTPPPPPRVQPEFCTSPEHAEKGEPAPRSYALGLCRAHYFRFQRDYLESHPDDKRHGTTTGVRYGCREERCRTKRAEMARDLRAKRRDKKARDT